MIIKPYEGIDSFSFDDNLDILQEKCGKYKSKIGMTSAMGVNFMTYHVRALNLHVVFEDKDGNRIESFEVFGGDLYFSDINIFKTEYTVLLSLLQKKDSLLRINSDELCSPKLGFRICFEESKDGLKQYPNSVLVFRDGYLDKKVPSIEDIINYYLPK